jgi:hypothetical protein
MLAYYIFLFFLIAILAVSSYSYEKIKTVTSNSDVSQKLILSTLIIASVIIFLSFFLHFINYISYERGSNMLSFGCLVTSILMILSYSYLDKEKKSSDQYISLQDQMSSVENNTNAVERDLSLIIGVIGLSVVAAYLFILIGKVFYSKNIIKTITVKEPLIIQPEDEKPIKIDYEQLRKKFIF